MKNKPVNSRFKLPPLWLLMLVALVPAVAFGAASPTITTPPQSQSVRAGSNAVFTVIASGQGTLTYQWSFNGTNLTNGARISGATATSLTISSITAADAGTYRITVSNSHGSVSTNAVLTVLLPPTITAQPTNLTANAFGTATFNVSASGTAPLAFQWRFNGTNLNGKTSSSLVLTNLQATNAGNYNVVITNNYGSITSAVVTLTVQLPPTILQQPQSQTVRWGANAGFSVIATGAPPTTFQWYFNGTNLLAGETNSALLLTNVQLAQAGYYSVVVGSPGWLAYSLNATLTVQSPSPGVPFITDLRPLTATPGATVTISGTNFSPITASNIVYMGAVRASVIAASGTNLTVTVPLGATFGPLSVSVGGLVGFSEQLFQPTFIGDGENLSGSSLGSSFNLGTGGAPGSCVIADLDNDGKPDIALVTGDNHAVAIFRNVGINGAALSAGSFASRLDLPFPSTGTGGTPYRLHAVDLDGDGRLDLIACEVSGARVSVYHNVSSLGSLTGSSFEPAFSLTTGSDCRFATATDVDGDGRTDIVALNYGAKTISVFPNIGTVGTLTAASFAAPVVLSAPGGPYEAVFADLDGDGRPDLAVASADSGTVSIFKNLATPGVINASSFGSRFDMPAGTTTETIIAADLDGDGRLDLISGSVQTYNINVFRNVSTGGTLSAGSFESRVDFGLPGWAHTVVAADFNGDAKPDLCVVGELGSYLALFQNISTAGSFTSSSLASRVDFGTGWNAWGVAAGDLNGDGRPDVVFCNAYDSNIQIYQNQVPFGGPATVIASPMDVAVPLDDTIRLSGDVVGLSPLSYQWVFHGTNLLDGGRISGATEGSLTISNAQLSDSGNYYFIVTNSLGSATSQVATVTVIIVPPAFVQQPQDQTNLVGGSATFSAQVNGSQPISYQWFHNGTPLSDDARITGATTASLNITNLQTNDALNYWLVVSNAANAATSSIASLTVLIPPSFTLQPVSQTTAVGSNVLFTASADGSEPLSYQWHLNGNPLTDNARVFGSTSSSLSISNVQSSDAGNYTIAVSIPGASVTSSNALLTVLVPADITIQPIGRSVPRGLPTTFSANASGSALTFQWLLNGTNIPNATGTTYTIPAVGTNDLGLYQFVASNEVSFAVSSNAWLTFGPVAAWGNNLSGESLPPPGLSNVIALAGGSGFSIALKGDGNVVAWGASAATNVPADLSNVVAIAAGPTHVLATRADGTVASWGTRFGTNVPVTVSNVVSVAGASSHSLALRREGTVFEWGATRNIPAPPVGMSKLTSISDGGSFSLATRSDGSVVQWGAVSLAGAKLASDFSFVYGITNAVSVAAGSTWSLALQSDGRVLAWGFGVLQTNVPANLTNAIAIATSASDATQGAGHCLALRTDGRVVAWGLNYSGQTNVPAALSNVVAIAAGSAQSLALVSDGAPVIIREPAGGTGFSGNQFNLNALVSGQLPIAYSWTHDGTNVPAATNAMLLLPNLQSADAGIYQLTASNALGVALSVPVPVTIQGSAPFLLSFPGVTNRANVGSSFTFTAVITGSGPLDGQWRFNDQNIPNETNTDLIINRVRATNAGQYTFTASNSFGAVTSSVATLYPLSVASWGTSVYGATNFPVTLSNAVAVAMNSEIVGALRADGTVATWGIMGTNVPSAISNITQIALESAAVGLGLRSDGTVKTWGSAVSLAFSNSVAGLSNIISVEADSLAATFLRPDGTVLRITSSGVTNLYPQLSNVVAFGKSDFGFAAICADGTVFTAAGGTPPPALATNVFDIAWTRSYGSVLKRDGTVQTWGTYGSQINASNMIALSANAAARADGTVLPWVWSPNYPSLSIVPPGLSNVTALDASSSAVLALLVDRDFPLVLLPDALNTTALVVSSRGSPQWFGQPKSSHDGLSAAQSAEIGDNTASSMRLWVAGPVTVSFWWKVSSETNHDLLSFSAGGVVLTNISGESDWQLCTVTTPPGNQILQWTYSKDGSGSAGQDTAWVDQLVITPVAPVIVTQPVGTNVLGGADVNLTVFATGTPPLSYQWQKNVALIPDATNQSLSFLNVTRSNSGTYSVVITNLAGNTVSSNAVVRVRVPQLLAGPLLMPGGTLTLDSADADGGTLSPEDLVNFEAQASTNLVDWTTLNGALSVVDGHLQLQDPAPTNYPARYYRIIEH